LWWNPPFDRDDVVCVKVPDALFPVDTMRRDIVIPSKWKTQNFVFVAL